MVAFNLKTKVVGEPGIAISRKQHSRHMKKHMESHAMEKNMAGSRKRTWWVLGTEKELVRMKNTRKELETEEGHRLCIVTWAQVKNLILLYML